jgi:hypothetical protein
LRSHPEVGRQRGGAKNPKSPTISTTFQASRRGLKFPKLYIPNLSQNSSLGEGPNIPQSPISRTFPKIPASERGQKSQKPYIHNLFLLSKIYNIFLGRAKYRNWWKPLIQDNELIKPVSDN